MATLENMSDEEMVMGLMRGHKPDFKRGYSWRAAVDAVENLRGPFSTRKTEDLYAFAQWLLPRHERGPRADQSGRDRSAGLMHLAKARIEIHQSPVGAGFYPEIAAEGFITSHISSDTVEAAIEHGLAELRESLMKQVEDK
jgi:hypothetical protein